MTVACRNSKHVYVGNGVNRIWPYTFSLPETAYMNVYLKEGSNAAVLLSPSLYTVNEASATVTYPLGDLPAIGPNTRLILLREVPYTQEIDLINQGDFYAETIEGGLDKTVMQIQQLAERADRALEVPLGDPRDPAVFIEDFFIAVEAAETSAQNAAASERAAETAKDVAVTAKTAAETAAISSANSQDAAATSASVSADSSAASESAKNDAVAAKEAAENAKTAAVAAKDAAVSAKTTAETAKDVAGIAANAAIAGATAAETARDIATTKASEAAASAANAANSAAAAAQSAADAAATVPEATETVAGKIAIATESEVTDGAVSTQAVTPATLAKGKAGGVATLDPSGKVPLSQLPITQSTAVEPHTITACDAAGEPSEITIGTETISISRDANGRLTAIQVGTATYTARYDADGRYTGLQ